MLYRLKSAIEYIRMIVDGLREIEKLQREIFDEKGMVNRGEGYFEKIPEEKTEEDDKAEEEKMRKGFENLKLPVDEKDEVRTDVENIK